VNRNIRVVFADKIGELGVGNGKKMIFFEIIPSEKHFFAIAFPQDSCTQELRSLLAPGLKKKEKKVKLSHYQL
jgi:hypothetical protein